MDTLAQQYKTHVLISLDHSASMRGIAKQAARDYNSQIATIKQNAIDLSQNVVVSLVNCGYGRTREVRTEFVNASITGLASIPEYNYETDGSGTPLYDSVGELIDIAKKSPDFADPNTSFLVLVVTDGEENSSRKWSAKLLANEIKTLQNTDRWTFAFRTPKGYARQLVNALGLYDGNVQEWETTARGMEQSTTITTTSLGSYFTARSEGKTATRSFYADLHNVSLDEVKAQLVDISAQVTSWLVQTEAEGSNIREFVEHKLGDKMLKGGAFYKLVGGKKTADKVQQTKLIMIRDKNTKVIYSGQAARDMLGLPKYGDAKLRPGDLGKWEVFVQSTSVNRKLPVGTEVLYWPQVGVHFKEGISA
jgi:hypothetical protein